MISESLGHSRVRIARRGQSTKHEMSQMRALIRGVKDISDPPRERSRKSHEHSLGGQADPQGAFRVTWG